MLKKLVKSECFEVRLAIICNLINKSLQFGQFPTDFQIANICSLLKKSSLDRNELTNYKPVLNLAFISKLFEKAIAAQLKDHLLENNLMENNFSLLIEKGIQQKLHYLVCSQIFCMQ